MIDGCEHLLYKVQETFKGSSAFAETDRRSAHVRTLAQRHHTDCRHPGWGVIGFVIYGCIKGFENTLKDD